MNVLYILGNGFDLAMGLKTSYPDFYKYLEKLTGSELLEKMKDEIKADKKNWSDMEEAFGKYTLNLKSQNELGDLYKDLTLCLQDYLMLEQKQFNPTYEQKKSFSNEFSSPVDSFIKGTDIQKFNSMILKNSDYHFNVVSFNYTDTLEKLLDYDENKEWKATLRSGTMGRIVHVHGVLGDSIIFGVDNTRQIANISFKRKRDATDLLIKKNSIEVLKSQDYEIFEKLITEANLIILYGVSLGLTDKSWWRKIKDELSNREDLRLVVHVFSPNSDHRTKQFAGHDERNFERLFVERSGLQFKKLPEELKDKVIFTVNSKAFKLRPQKS